MRTLKELGRLVLSNEAFGSREAHEFGVRPWLMLILFNTVRHHGIEGLDEILCRRDGIEVILEPVPQADFRLKVRIVGNDDLDCLEFKTNSGNTVLWDRNLTPAAAEAWTDDND